MTKYIDRYYLNGELYGIKFAEPIPMPLNGLIAYYPFDGDVLDHKADLGVSGTSYDCSWVGSSNYVTGKTHALAYSNSGSNQNYLTTPNTGDLLTLNEQTIMFWGQIPNGVSSWASFFIYKGQPGIDFGVIQIYYNKNLGKLVYRLNKVDNTSYNPDGSELVYSTPVMTSWCHIAGTYDGATAKLYINGQLVQSYNYNYTVAQGSSSKIYNIGGEEDTANEVNMNDLLIYNRPLTAEEILGYYNATA